MKDANNNQILHFGKIIERNAEKGYIKLKIKDSHDCESCPAINLCNHLSLEDNVIIISTEVDFEIGEQVKVIATEVIQRKAIMLAVAYPCIILVLTMTLTYILTMNESIAAIAGLLLMITFFIVLYLIRNKIAREFKFEIIRIK